MNPGADEQLKRWRAETEAAARACLTRAAGQQGVLRLPVELSNPPGPPQPCNAATLFELHWQILKDGRIRVRASIDGLMFGDWIT